MTVTVGVIANPVSGRDIPRVAARRGVSTAEDKRNRIARAVIGAVTAGADHIIAMQEPFRIASGALADLTVAADLEILDIGASVAPDDTKGAALALRDRGVEVLITLGGDGTNRTIAQVWPDAILVPMSTGTNNVFPSLVEPTVAGAAAGLVAAGIAPLETTAPRTKMIHLDVADGVGDLALIDAVTLADDFVGNRMPVEPENLRDLVVTNAKPDSIGVSSIAGLVHHCPASEDAAVHVRCGPGGQVVAAPIAPGLYRRVPVLSTERVELGQPIELDGPTVLAFDGDREHRIAADRPAIATVCRDGPRVIDVAKALAAGADAGAFTGVAVAAEDSALVSPNLRYTGDG